VAVGQQGPADISKPKWVFQTGGDVFSSPAVVKGKVYIGSHDKNWYCLDAYTGQKIWNFTVGHYVRSSCAVIGGRVYTGPDDGNIYCLNAETGELIWKTPVGGFFPYYLDPNEATLCSSPIVIEDRIYVGSLDGKVYCLRTTDGRVLYTYTTNGPIFGSPAYYNYTIYIASTDGWLYALSSSDLSLRWRSPFQLNMSVRPPAYCEFYNVGTPSVVNGVVYIGGGVQYGEALLSTAEYLAMNMSVPVGANGGGIRMFAFNATTGASIWNISRAGNTQPMYIPAVWQGQIYAPEFFEVTAMNATDPKFGTYVPPDFVYTNRRNFNRTRGQWLGYQIEGSVAYADDLTGPSPKIYVGSDIGSLYCLNPLTMETLSVFTAGSNIPGSPSIWDGKVYVGAVNGKVYCFDDSPVVSTTIYAASNKGAEMWNNETIVISGTLYSNPIIFKWEANIAENGTYLGGRYAAYPADFHPGIPNATVKLCLTKPGGTEIYLTATTDKKGKFNFTYSPTEVGEWGWVVYYEGETKPKTKPSLTYADSYGEWNAFKVTAPPTSAPPEQPTPQPEQGYPTEYIWAAAIIIIIAIIAAAAYILIKRKK
jgi:outer membrane protein assembly factor BamB